MAVKQIINASAYIERFLIIVRAFLKYIEQM